MHLSPAEFVIRRFGGVRATARALKRTPSAVSRWRSIERIPSKMQQKIIVTALKLNLDIKPADLIVGRNVKP